MRETTRRLICRIVFVTLCIVPTVFTCGLILYRVSPLWAAAEKKHWQQAIHDRLGLSATIGQITRPRGGVTLLKQVTLTDPDSERRVLTLRLAELARTDLGLVILLSQPEVDEGQFLRLWEILQLRVLRAGPPPGTIQLTAGELTLHAPPQTRTLTNVRCSIEPTTTGTKALIDFHVAGTGMKSAAQIQLVRNRQVYPPATGWQLRTGPTPLPCSLFASYCPPLKRLGSECLFHGAIWAEQSADGWNGEIAGRFHRVDLERLIEPFPHKLSGRADVVLNHASFRQGRIRDAAGSIQAGGGVISHSLVATFGEAFQLQVQPREDTADEPLREFKQMAFGFQLDAEGVRLSGLCEGAEQGALLVDGTGPLLRDTHAEAIPAVALARALSPYDNLQVPATRESDFLLRALPLPSTSTPPSLTAERPPRATVRLKRE